MLFSLIHGPHHLQTTRGFGYLCKKGIMGEMVTAHSRHQVDLADNTESDYSEDGFVSEEDDETTLPTIMTLKKGRPNDIDSEHAGRNNGGQENPVTRTVTEFHVTFSEAYSVPVLYFNSTYLGMDFSLALASGSLRLLRVPHLPLFAAFWCDPRRKLPCWCWCRCWLRWDAHQGGAGS